MLALASGHLGVERVESLTPQDAVGAQLLVELREGLGPDHVVPPLGRTPDVDQSGLPQHPEVSRDSRPGDRQEARQLAHRGRAPLEPVEHRATAVVGQRLQHCTRLVTPAPDLGDDDSYAVSTVGRADVSELEIAMTRQPTSAELRAAFTAYARSREGTR